MFRARPWAYFMRPAYAPGKPQLSRFCKIVRLNLLRFWQEKTQRRRREQRAAQNSERNGDAMGPAFQYSDVGWAQITADVAERIHQTDNRAGGRTRHGFSGNGKERGQPRKRPRNGQTQKRVRQPKGMFLEQHARDERCASHGINEGGV